jgi:hypothetical protein
MAARSVRRHRHHVRHLLGVLHRDVQPLPSHDAHPSAFIEGELGSDQLGVIGDQPSHPPLAALLLVGVRDEDHVARQRAALVDDVPLEQQHRLEVRREHTLVVDRAATVQVVALDLGGERVHRPVRALDADDVHVPHDQHGLLAPVALDARHERAAARRRLEEVRLDPGCLECAVEVARDGKLVARRIHRVHPDHRLQVLERLLPRGSPVGLLRGGDRGSGGECHQGGGDE